MNLPAQHATVIDPSRLEPGHSALWREWCRISPAFQRAFLTPEFTLAAARALPGVRIAVIFENGRPAAFFPFQFPTRRHAAIGWAQPCAFGLSDCFGLVAAPGFSIRPEQLLPLAGISHIYFDHLDGVQQDLGLTGTGRRSGLIIELPGGPLPYWDALASKDKEFLQDTERRQRQLASRVGPIVFSTNATAENLNQLVEYKRRQYAATGAADPLAPAPARRLLNELLNVTSPLCEPVLLTLHAGSTWVASHFGLRCLGRLHYWFPVYNPELRRYAPGRLLLKAIIDRASELGLTLIDRGEGESSAKADLANASRSFATGAWTRPNLRGMAARLANSLLWRLARTPSKEPD